MSATNEQILDLLTDNEDDRKHLKTRLEYIRRQMDSKESVTCEDFYGALRWALLITENRLAAEDMGLASEGAYYSGGK